MQGDIYHYRKRVPDALRTVLERSELWCSLKTDSYQIACRRLHSAAAMVEARLETARNRSAAHVGDDLTSYDSFEFDHQLQQISRSTIKSLGQVYEEYISDPRHNWSPRTAMAHQTSRKWALEIFGLDTVLKSISREQCREFVNILVQVPRHADRKFKGASLKKAIELADRQASNDRISIANVNAYINRFSGFFNWCIAEGYIEKNPMKGLKLPDPVRKRDKRHSFSDEQLRKIFNAPLYTGCIDDENGYAKIGYKKPRRARFWIPLIALFSGMRMNEICQLDTPDVKKIDGIWCFSIFENADTNKDRKRLKTLSSERLVPIHPKLMEIGFIEFVNKKTSDCEEKLFAEIIACPDGYYSTNFSKWFRRFLSKAEANAERTCFHSFRHCFRDALRRSGVSRDLALSPVSD